MPVPGVLHLEGLAYGFLKLTTLEGEVLADGELKQDSKGDRVTSELIFHFKDTSVHDETVIFTQRRRFRILSYHLVQKGPAFKHPMDVQLNGTNGQINVRSQEEDGKEKTISQTLQITGDLANGMLPILLKNLRRSDPGTTLSYVAVTPKPRIVKLSVTRDGEEWFSAGNSSVKAAKYVVKIELGGIAGVVAPIVGKQPEDSYMWILTGDTPAFIKSEGPLYAGGPSWRIELSSPMFKNH